jgi:hypothetical protein
MLQNKPPWPGGLFVSKCCVDTIQKRALSFNIGRDDMRFQIEVNTLDGKLAFHKDNAADAVEVAKGAKANLGVTITDTSDGTIYKPEDFDKLLAK